MDTQSYLSCERMEVNARLRPLSFVRAELEVEDFFPLTDCDGFFCFGEVDGSKIVVSIFREVIDASDIVKSALQSNRKTIVSDDY